MSKKSLAIKLKDFSQALAQLDEAINQPESNPLAIDGTIQRFEFCFELAWKSTQAKLMLEGIQVA